jgi:hypothetical protein
VCSSHSSKRIPEFYATRHAPVSFHPPPKYSDPEAWYDRAMRSIGGKL